MSKILTLVNIILNLTIVLLLTALGYVFWAVNHPRHFDQNVTSKFVSSKIQPPPFDFNQRYDVPHEFPPIVRLIMNNESECSATVISDTYLLSAAHCFVNEILPGMYGEPTKTAEMYRLGGTEPQIVNLIALSQNSDLAILSGDFSKFGRIKLAYTVPEYYTRLQNRSIWSCGYPRNSKEISCVRQGDDSRIFYYQVRMSGAMWPGMSGGPTMDLSGGIANAVILGVNSGVLDGAVVYSSIIYMFDELGIKVKQ